MADIQVASNLDLQDNKIIDAYQLTDGSGNARVIPRSDTLYGFHDFRWMPDGSVHNAQTNGNGFGDPDGIIDAFTNNGGGPELAGYLTEALVVNGTLRNPGGATVAAIGRDLPVSYRIAVTLGIVPTMPAETPFGDENTYASTRIAFIDVATDNGYVGYIEWGDSGIFGTGGPRFRLVRDDSAIPTTIAGPWSLPLTEEQITDGSHYWTLERVANTYKFYLDGHLINEHTASASDPDSIFYDWEDETSTGVVLNSEGLNLPGVNWWGISYGGVVTPSTWSEANAALAVYGTPPHYLVNHLGAALSFTDDEIDGDPSNLASLGVNPVLAADLRDPGGSILPINSNAENDEYVMVVNDPMDRGFPLGLYKVASPYWEYIDNIRPGSIGLVSIDHPMFSGAEVVYTGYGPWGGWDYVMMGVLKASISQRATVGSAFESIDLGSVSVNEIFRESLGTLLLIGTDNFTITLPSAETHFGRTVTFVKESATGTVTIAAQAGESILSGATSITGTAYEVRQYRAISLTGWIEVSGSGGASALADLTDVDVTTDAPANNDVLAWDSAESKWTPATLLNEEEPVKALGIVPDSRLSLQATYGTPAFEWDNIATVTTSALPLGEGFLAYGCKVNRVDLRKVLFSIAATNLTAGQTVEFVCYGLDDDKMPGALEWMVPITVGTSTGAINHDLGASSGLFLPQGGYYIGFWNPSGNAGTITFNNYYPANRPVSANNTAGSLDRYAAIRGPSATTAPSTLADFDINSAPNTSSRLGVNLTAPGIWLR